jgi:hypothetical protein
VVRAKCPFYSSFLPKIGKAHLIAKIPYAHFGSRGMTYTELLKWVENSRKMSVHNGSNSLQGRGAIPVQIFEVLFVENKIATSAPFALSSATNVRFPGRDIELMLMRFRSVRSTFLKTNARPPV